MPTETTLLAYLKEDRSHARTLALACDCTTSQLYRIAHGRRRCGSELAVKLQRATGGRVTVATLLPDLADAFAELRPPEAQPA